MFTVALFTVVENWKVDVFQRLKGEAHATRPCHSVRTNRNLRAGVKITLS